MREKVQKIVCDIAMEAGDGLCQGYEEDVDKLLSLREAEIKSLVEEVRSRTKEQLDKNDPDNYGACYAIGGWNHALSQVIDLLEGKIKEE
jgi:precorrin isomerase